MAAGTYTALSLDVLEPVSKSYHITYSKRAFCVSQKLGGPLGAQSFSAGVFGGRSSGRENLSFPVRFAGGFCRPGRSACTGYFGRPSGGAVIALRLSWKRPAAPGGKHPPAGRGRGIFINIILSKNNNIILTNNFPCVIMTSGNGGGLL